MRILLTLSHYIDKLNNKIGLSISWGILIAIFICSGNALTRYLFNTSSNAWLEIQWYLISSVFLMACAHTLYKDEHIRIDVFSSKFSHRTQILIDIIGFTLFLLPFSLLMTYHATIFAWQSILSQDISNNSGGLILWPAKLCIPIGFTLLTLQGISELIKRVAILLGIQSSQRPTHSGLEEELHHLHDHNTHHSS